MAEETTETREEFINRITITEEDFGKALETIPDEDVEKITASYEHSLSIVEHLNGTFHTLVFNPEMLSLQAVANDELEILKGTIRKDLISAYEKEKHVVEFTDPSLFVKAIENNYRNILKGILSESIMEGFVEHYIKDVSNAVLEVIAEMAAGKEIGEDAPTEVD